ncbi:MAG: transporter substrate-binding domain-containing protein [Pseudomonadota bacterium]
MRKVTKKGRGGAGLWPYGGTALVAVLTMMAGALSLPETAQAQSVECGGDYDVVPGDTLSEIAVRAYGVGRFGPIFEANRQTIRSPQTLEIGDTIFIPCLDGTGNPLPRGVRPSGVSVTSASAAAETEVTTVPEIIPVPGTEENLEDLGDVTTVRLLAVRASAPYVGAELPEGGMLTEIVQRSLLRAPVPLDFEVSFKGGENASDIANGGYDLGYPVVRPNCETPSALGPTETTLCDNYLFSAPIYTGGIGMFVTKAGDFANAAVASDLFGTRVCRPAGMGTSDLAASGLVAPNVNPVPGASMKECFQMLQAGDVSVVSVPETEGRAMAESLGMTSKIVALAGIGQGQALHVASPRANAVGGSLIAVIDRGLAEMRRSGSYEAVVENHLAFAGIN